MQRHGRGVALSTASVTIIQLLSYTFLPLVSFLRVISRAPGLKLVVETLITSLKPIGNIVLICCAFFIIFGILGVQVQSPRSSSSLSHAFFHSFVSFFVFTPLIHFTRIRRHSNNLIFISFYFLFLAFRLSFSLCLFFSHLTLTRLLQT